jgi:hypothetical protein
MEFGGSAASRAGTSRWAARLRASLVAGAGVVAIVVAAPSGAWAFQANDNSSATDATGGGLLGVVAPITSAVQANVGCPINVNIAANQSDSGVCQPDDQSNSNSSSTLAGAGSLIVAPITAAAGINLNCPVNVNVLANQRNSGSCVPSSQSNANDATTFVGGGSPDVLGGPIVAPLTTGLGVNATCPANVNVLSNQTDSGNCLPAVAAPASPAPANPAPDASPPSTSAPSGDAPADDAPPVAYSGGLLPADATDAPLPPSAGAVAIGGPARAVAFPALGVLVLVVLASAALAARRLGRG